MSLDYILLSGNLDATSVDELVEDHTLSLGDYQVLAQKIFPGVEWESESLVAGISNLPSFRAKSGHTICAEISVELTAHDRSLHLSCRGNGDIYLFAIYVARMARNLGLIVLDVQSSEILDPESSESSPEYIEWYRHVQSRTSC